MNSGVKAALLVALAAFAWGAGSLISVPELSGVPGAALTLYEHVIGLLILIPFVVRPSRRELRLIRLKHLPAIFMIGIAGETLAGIFFSQSYESVGGAAAGFFQMLQPFFVLAFVLVLGRERRGASYMQWAFWVLMGAMAICVFDPTFEFQKVETSEFWRGAGLGFLAVALWAASNISAKSLLDTFSPSSLVFMRWALSLVGLGVALKLNGTELNLSAFASARAWLVLICHTAVFSLIPLWIFYRGLKYLPASLATFIGLTCPLAILFLPALFRIKELHELQWLGGVSVVIGVALLLRLELEFVSSKKLGKP